MNGVVAALSGRIDRGWLVDALKSLVRTPSVTGCEDAAQHEMVRLLRELDMEVDVWRPDVPALQQLPNFPGARALEPRLNVVGTFHGVGNGPRLVLNGHIDTVPAGDEHRWTHAPFGAEVSEGRLYGRGACDMKGALAAILTALRAIRNAGIRLQGSVCVQSVIGEEDGGLGTFAALVKGYRGDAAVVCEPTRLAVAPAQPGFAIFRLTIPGLPAHASVRHEGISAFERFLPIHRAVRALERRRNHNLRHPLYEELALPWAINFGVVRSGSWPGMVPESLSTEGRVAGAIGEPMTDVRRQFEEVVRHTAARDPWLSRHPPTVEWIGGAGESVHTPCDHPLVQVLLEAVLEATGRPGVVQGMPYGSDLRLFTNEFGVPAVLFGPGDIRVAHFTDEFVPIAEVEAAALTLALLTVLYCGVC